MALSVKLSALAGEGHGPKKEAAILAAAAAAHLDRDEDKQALKIGLEALSAFRALEDTDAVADVLTVVIAAYALQGDARRASTMAAEEAAFFIDARDTIGEGKMLLAQATVAYAENDSYDAAKRAAMKARTVFRDAGDKELEATAVRALADVLLKAVPQNEKGSREVMSVAHEALDLCRAAGDKKGEGMALYKISQAHVVALRHEEAVEVAEDALELLQEQRHCALVEASVLQCLAEWCLQSKQHSKGLKYAEDAYELFGEHRNARKEARALSTLVQAHLANKEVHRALRAANSGLYRFQDANDLKGEAEALMARSAGHADGDNIFDALKDLEKAVDILRDCGDKALEATALCKAADLQARLGKLDKAQTSAQRAMDLAREMDKFDDEANAMKVLVSVQLQQEEHEDAIDTANRMRSVFEQAGAKKQQAVALMVLCDSHKAAQDHNDAIHAAKAAQTIYHEEDDEAGEAQVLNAMTELYMMEDAFDKAVKTAERARALWRSVADRVGEANAMIMLATAQLNVQAKKEGKENRGGRGGWDKALKTSKDALVLARKMPDEQRGSQYIAHALVVLTQVYMAVGKIDECMKSANEAVALCRETGDAQMEAFSLVLCAQVQLAQGKLKEAREDASEALAIYQDSKNEDMIEAAKKVIQEVEAQEGRSLLPQLTAAQAPQQQQLTAIQMMQQQQAQQEIDQPKGAQAVSRVRTGGTGALDLAAGVEMETVRAKIFDTVANIIGDEEEDIEADTPLMQAGLTSNTAVLLRDELSNDIPGINLPPTLIFDYPSINSIAEFVVEKSIGR